MFFSFPVLNENRSSKDVILVEKAAERNLFFYDEVTAIWKKMEEK